MISVSLTQSLVDIVEVTTQSHISVPFQASDCPVGNGLIQILFIYWAMHLTP